MFNPTDSRQTLTTLVDLLQESGFHVQAQIYEANHPHTKMPEDLLGMRADLVVELSGPDTSLLTARNGELLLAIEEVAARMLDLEPEEQHRISVDAGDFKIKRDKELRSAVETAILRVKSTGKPYTFPPMMSRERRLVHLALAKAGLNSASTGESFRRSVVVYPEGMLPPAEQTPNEMRRPIRPRRR